jgi:hypothetical protein
MCIENVEPSANRFGAVFTDVTEPDPSNRVCWQGSANRSKICDGVAGIIRETEIERDDDIGSAYGGELTRRSERDELQRILD